MDNRDWLLKRISIVDAMKFAFDITPMLIVNETYIIEWSTPEINKLLGYISGELDGKLLSIVIPPELRETHFNHFKKYFSSPEDRNMGTDINQVVFNAYCKNGSTKKVSIALRSKAIEGEVKVGAFVFPIIEIK